jgi:hypothetical protein
MHSLKHQTACQIIFNSFFSFLVFFLHIVARHMEQISSSVDKLQYFAFSSSCKLIFWSVKGSNPDSVGLLDPDPDSGSNFMMWKALRFTGGFSWSLDFLSKKNVSSANFCHKIHRIRIRIQLRLDSLRSQYSKPWTKFCRQRSIDGISRTPWGGGVGPPHFLHATEHLKVSRFLSFLW